MKRTTLSERALVLAPVGRDAAVAVAMLAEAKIKAEACRTLADLVHQLDKGAAFVVVTEEALATADLHRLSAWLADQEEWSDLPFVLITSRGGGLERNPAAQRLLDVLGNVTFLERPFHPTTLISLALRWGDNTAADVLMKRIGGPGSVTAWLRGLQIMEIRVDRYAREAAMDLAALPSFRAAWKDANAFLAARDQVAAPDRQRAMDQFMADPRDSATVPAMLEFLYKVAGGQTLSAASTTAILRWMETTAPGTAGAIVCGTSAVGNQVVRTRYARRETPTRSRTHSPPVVPGSAHVHVAEHVRPTANSRRSR